MSYEFFLENKIIPNGFKYSDSYVKYVGNDFPDFDPWDFYGDDLRFAFDGLKDRYPSRIVVPFARRNDNDDIACFDASVPSDDPIVVIIHDFASPGWEDRGELENFDAWVKLAKLESEDFQRYLKEGNVLDFTALSKAISYVLRHEPWAYELELDDEGWVEIDDLRYAIGKIDPTWYLLREVDFQELINRSDKKRHEVKDGKIRALYGHSTPQKLIKEPAVPPDILYHGTSPRRLKWIMEDALLSMQRHYVHLSPDKETAYEVGKRKHYEPVILVVDASKASKEGIQFYRGNDKVWLADPIPAKYIKPL